MPISLSARSALSFFFTIRLKIKMAGVMSLTRLAAISVITAYSTASYK